MKKRLFEILLPNRFEKAVLRLYCIKQKLPFKKLTDDELIMVNDTFGATFFRLAVAVRNLKREIINQISNKVKNETKM